MGYYLLTYGSTVKKTHFKRSQNIQYPINRKVMPKDFDLKWTEDINFYFSTNNFNASHIAVFSLTFSHDVSPMRLIHDHRAGRDQDQVVPNFPRQTVHLAPSYPRSTQHHIPMINQQEYCA